MKRMVKKKFKKGAASFYVVAFSTLILIIIATSFAAVIISEITRTANDDLAQSAYDSALAGVEDAKLAYYSYANCLKEGATAGEKPAGGGAISCQDIVWWVENGDCDMVAHILGRIGKDDASEVLVKEETVEGDNAMQQAYTCAKIKTELSDYRSTLSSNNSTKIIRVKLDGKEIKEIESVRVSWYSNTDGNNYAFTNFKNGKVDFPLSTASKMAAPPTISVGIVQTAATFRIDDFDRAESGRTNRGTVYLVPTNNAESAKRTESTAQSNDIAGNYIGAYNGSENVVTANQIVKTNDRTVKNLPFVTYCPVDQGNEFACSATLRLPKPIDGDRNNDTFIIVLSLPYGQPSTDFALEFCTGAVCETQVTENEEGESDITTNVVELKGMQVSIDSTGRANDLYRRVEARVDTQDEYFPYPLYALELLGDDSDSLLKKNFYVTCENNFGIDNGAFISNCD